LRETRRGPPRKVLFAGVVDPHGPLDEPLKGPVGWIFILGEKGKD